MSSPGIQTGFRQQQAQKLLQKMSPQMIQSISLLSMPVEELRDKIYEEVEKNPALEVVRDASIEVPGVRITQKSASSADSDVYQAFIESAPSRTETLQEHLLMQLSIQKLSEKERNLGEKLIQNLDNRGYHVESPEKLLQSDETESLLDQVLQIIQSFDPVGVCCFDVRESLLIQAKQIDLTDEIPKLVIPLLEDFFETLEHPRPSLVLSKLAKSEKIDASDLSIEKVESAINFIQTLDPYPARQFSVTSETAYVSPDIRIRRSTEDELNETGDDFVVEFVKTNLPQVQISSVFKEYAAENKSEKNDESKKFVQNSIKDAQWFLNSVNQRNLTLLKTSKVILDVQHAFFINGPKFLLPLRMKDVAAKVGVHETTISRIANEKYIQCEWGLFEIKYFFSNAVVHPKEKTNTVVLGAPSKESVKQELRAIIEKEGGKLSDSRLTEMLSARGIKIARRTVAKYRGELNIASSFDRK